MIGQLLVFCLAMALAIPATEFSFRLGPSARTTTEEKHASSSITADPSNLRVTMSQDRVFKVLQDRGGKKP